MSADSCRYLCFPDAMPSMADVHGVYTQMYSDVSLPLLAVILLSTAVPATADFPRCRRSLCVYNPPKIRTGPLCARGVLGFETAPRSNLAHHLSADYLWMTFCRLSAVGCLLFLVFCCLSVGYLLICYHFREIRGKQKSPPDSTGIPKNHVFVGAHF